MNVWKLEKGSAKGVVIACTIIVFWLMAMLGALLTPVGYSLPLNILLILLLTHLYTGLFITAHDAMHGAVSWNRKVNLFFGQLCTTLFMFNSFKVLFPKHYDHHKFAGTENDPDYHPPHPVKWYLKFLLEYISLRQLILAAITFNLLRLWFPVPNLLLFWILPSLLSTLQLFIFGTYLPHHGEHQPQNRHRARSQHKNHFLAFITCYFFGYHYEHHDSPQTPWWLLHKMKDR
ncbi:fatty acid desaturase [Sphingobacteriales bacterium UPWRP_1]|nr:fatty acid desaturase [Sphingobacteriales bacterium TSM_CSM]PSJ72731.1 fatty acid desaturase [Sphingobacteriales bacterium UPWRP_1]